MTAGQRGLWVAADAAALAVLEQRLAVQETARSAAHAEQLRTVLELDALYSGRGMGIGTVPHAALALGCSERRASRLLEEGRALAELPGALEALGCGLLTVEQSAVVVQQLAVLPLAGRLAVWRRLQQRLTVATAPLPPARLSELLRRWVVEADPADAVARRQRARDERRVDYRLGNDGLGQLFASGFTAPDLHAVLSRIAELSRPWGVEDERSADQRRFDALRDLLLGRSPLPDGCCPSGDGAPCGAELQVLLPIGAALGTTDEAAELVGAGPLDGELVQQLLLAAPRLRPVWVDPDGVVVAVGDTAATPQRDDRRAVRQALVDLAALPPPPVDRHDRAAHPPGRPGPYRPPRRVRRLVDARAPRCEWPGCGARALLCDSEHDQAWPDGPTCPCNLGPCCRRHHRVKQQGWTKARSRDALTWTAPTGSTWSSPAQHPPPAAPVRRPSPVPGEDEWEHLSPWQREAELDRLGLLPPDDPEHWASPLDLDPDDEPDLLGLRLLETDTRWTLDLTDPYRWLDPASVTGP